MTDYRSCWCHHQPLQNTRPTPQHSCKSEATKYPCHSIQNNNFMSSFITNYSLYREIDDTILFHFKCIRIYNTPIIIWKMQKKRFPDKH